MATQGKSLRMLFFPFMAPGHLLPMLDMAKLFAGHGVNCTVLTTPANAAVIRSSLDRHAVEILTVPFPSAAVGLPDGCENLYSVPSPELEPNFYKATGMLRDPFDLALAELLPDCIVIDMFLPWAYRAADRLHVPTLIFYGISYFSHCVFDSISRHNPLQNLPAEEESFVIPGIPHTINMFKSQLGNIAKDRPDLMEIIMEAKKVEATCYGMVMNSFYELEPDYVKHCTEVIGRRTWHLGPVSLCNGDTDDMAARGNDAASNECQKILHWLDSKSPGSVVYACFGGASRFSDGQLREIAMGLEAAGHPFVWVVRQQNDEAWMLEEYERRIEGKGLIVRGWAPQMLILNHAAVGGFVTHCGWNSTLEAVSAGLPLVTWPQFADQFFNERMVVDVLKIGVAVGVRSMVAKHGERELVVAARIENAVRLVIGGGEDGDHMRRRAKELGSLARKAVEEGGSSYVHMDNLIRQLTERRTAEK